MTRSAMDTSLSIPKKFQNPGWTGMSDLFPEHTQFIIDFKWNIQEIKISQRVHNITFESRTDAVGLIRLKMKVNIIYINIYADVLQVSQGSVSIMLADDVCYNAQSSNFDRNLYVYERLPQVENGWAEDTTLTLNTSGHLE